MIYIRIHRRHRHHHRRNNRAASGPSRYNKFGYGRIIAIDGAKLTVDFEKAETSP